MYQIEPLSPDFTEETGSRTLALFEIMIRTPWRGTGVARKIHEELLAYRTEERVPHVGVDTEVASRALHKAAFQDGNQDAGGLVRSLKIPSCGERHAAPSQLSRKAFSIAAALHSVAEHSAARHG